MPKAQPPPFATLADVRAAIPSARSAKIPPIRPPAAPSRRITIREPSGSGR